MLRSTTGGQRPSDRAFNQDLSIFFLVLKSLGIYIILQVTNLVDQTPEIKSLEVHLEIAKVDISISSQYVSVSECQRKPCVGHR